MNSHATKLTPDVAEIISAARCEGPHLRLVAQLDRTTYTKVDKILKLMGGTWSRKLGVHVFDGDATEAVEDALATGSVADLRKLFQHFPTPPELADEIVARAGIRKGWTVLEPSAGEGRIAHALKKAGAVVHVCEIQTRFHMSLRGRGDGFEIVSHDDFLQLPASRTYDAVVANPPFTRGQDVQHVTRMLGHVKPGGIVASVMSPAWRYRTTKLHTEFRERMEEMGAAWDELPKGSFASSGTDVSTGLLRVRVP